MSCVGPTTSIPPKKERALGETRNLCTSPRSTAASTSRHAYDYVCAAISRRTDFFRRREAELLHVYAERTNIPLPGRDARLVRGDLDWSRTTLRYTWMGRAD
jgi:hypothetical protein